MKILKYYFHKQANEQCYTIKIEGAFPFLETTKIKMQQVFLNLINNAILHCDKKQIEILIHSTEEKNGWHFSVQDNGPGIEEQFHERIFVIFQRLNGRSEYEGTGIGLAICKKIVENHNGTISAQGKPNGGATFTVTLPIGE